MKKITVLLATLALLLAAATASASFTDVPAGMWYSDAVAQMTAAGIMSGTSATQFAPSSTVTRGTVVTVLWRLSGAPKLPDSPSFPDVDSGSWYAQSAHWARLMGIATGYANDEFGGDDPVTREQLAIFLHRYTLYSGGEIAEGILTPYPDAGAISPWALTGMRHAVGAGLIAGNAAGELNPRGSAQRAELAVTLLRFLTPAAG